MHNAARPGTFPAVVAVGDFNGDGKPDLALADTAFGVLSVYLGNGDGTFQGAQTVATGIALGALAVGDFNGDGNPDLVVGTAYAW
jgi:hypothetical protein